MKKVVLIASAVIAIIALILIIVSISSNIYFNYKVTNEIDAFLEKNQEIEKAMLDSRELEHLPVPVQRWLTASGILDRELGINARSKHTAMVRLDQNQENWHPLQADQYFSVKEPGFLWNAKFSMAPFIYIAGRDMYDDGRGHMLIKLQSLIPIADSKGYEIDQGSLLRYLAEIVWVPSAALENYITWESIDVCTAKATMNYEGVSASGVFTFDEEGNAVHFIADRYGEFDGDYLMKPWSIEMFDHQFIDGYNVPTKAEITWKLDSGDYTWYKLELQELEYNISRRY